MMKTATRTETMANMKFKIASLKDSMASMKFKITSLEDNTAWLESEIALLNAKHDDEIALLNTKHDDEIALLNTKHDDEIALLTAQSANDESEIDLWTGKSFDYKEMYNALSSHSTTQDNIISAYAVLLRRIANQLAVQSIVQLTHRNRDELNRSMVRQIINELGTPVSNYVHRTPSELEDVPF